jgi:hypothetical protein
VVAVDPSQRLGQQRRLPRRPRTSERLEQAGPGLERRGGGREQEQAARELKDREQTVAAIRCPRQVGDLRLVGPRDPDVQLDRKRGQPHGQDADDHDRQSQRGAPEARPPAVIELAELGDRSRGCLRAGGQRHRDGEGEQHRHHRRAGRPGDRRRAVGERRSREAEPQRGDGRHHEQARHDREDEAAAMPEQGEGTDGNNECQRERDPDVRQVGDVGDHRAASGGDRDRDREREVDDQGADRQERPRLAERPAGGLGRPTTLGEALDQLPVVQRDQRDDPDDQPHRRQQQAKVAVERAQRRLDRVGHRRDRVGHHREREREEQQYLRAGQAPAERESGGGRHGHVADQASRRTETAP